jgi:hypothetical protein
MNSRDIRRLERAEECAALVSESARKACSLADTVTREQVEQVYLAASELHKALIALRLQLLR